MKRSPVTISTHNGSAIARDHNIRNPKVVAKEEHIDLSMPHEIWIDEPIRKAYDRIFGEALDEYNAKRMYGNYWRVKDQLIHSYGVDRFEAERIERRCALADGDLYHGRPAPAAVYGCPFA